MDQGFEFRAIEQPVLERPSLTHHLLVAAVVDCFEVVGVEFGEQGIMNAQRGIMNAQISFEDFAAVMDFLQTPHCRRGAAVVATKIDQGLLALENRGRS